ncbi:hypothetical protein F0L68_00630 [Solihabitans fulvus]|uniref:Uncharacterized protein n=1 Tax=Solihabitans fulvus TaxID=1892852 RepID=A0A5B2XW11_9PSEU|nr:hypothetical protein [Solihabitans fulvus]KAA2267072.1 hypothetical protein F0L68_00630 [Solihabitans fulvus]
MTLRRRLVRWASTLGALLVATAVVLAIVSMIWPGMLKVVAPLLCDADHRTPVLVTTYVGEGTTETMYCMGERGQTYQVGDLWPLVVLWACFSAIVLVVLAIGRSRRLLTRSRTTTT